MSLGLRIVSWGAPHWFHDGPEVAILVTVSYFSTATTSESRVEDCDSLPGRSRSNLSISGPRRAHRLDEGDHHADARSCSVASIALATVPAGIRRWRTGFDREAC